MKTLALILRMFAAICLLVGLLHLVLGLQAEQLLGAGLGVEAITNASLDSQNRFYGTQFMLAGVVSWICARDVVGHSSLLRALLFVFFLGGIARLVSLAMYGWPSPPIQLLAISELVLPPVLLVWHTAIVRRQAATPKN